MKILLIFLLFYGSISSGFNGVATWAHRRSVSVGGFNWYFGNPGDSCDTTCMGYGGANAGTITYTGSGGTLANCDAVLTALGSPGSAATNSTTCTTGNGCILGAGGANRYRCTNIATTTASSFSTARRACACNSSSAQSDPCPAGYILVPALAGYTSSNFCVAKYEAKQSGAIAISQATGTPWVSIGRDASITACQANGAKYDLITNNEWQTIARNIELVPANWSSGVVGTGSINRGHSDGTPGNSIAGSSVDTDACNGTGQVCSNTTWDTQRRTHVFSNGKVIWDFAGNVWEWMKDNNSTLYNPEDYISLITDPTSKSNFGPSGSYLGLNSGEYGGFGYGWINSATGAITRGGDYDDTDWSGIFAADLYYNSSTSSPIHGFRCVYHP